MSHEVIDLEIEASYEEVPYDSQPHYATHPDCLATVSALMGLRPVVPRRFRYLELGCGTGGNVVPMAATMPESSFVGIDLSAKQIEMGREMVRALGLENMDLRAMNIMEVGREMGEFDYIVCHGVYSWAPAPVRDKIMQICRELLAPQGVAYISYNTLPGWHARAPLRDALRYHLRDCTSRREQIERARELLHFLANRLPESSGGFTSVLRKEAAELATEPDYYILHEHLDAVSEPIYFRDFVAHARRHGLDYLAEAWFHPDLERLPPQVQEVIRGWSEDLVEVQQYLDFYQNRSFRRSLICHSEAQFERKADIETVARMHATALARPISEQPDVMSSATETFHTRAGETISTNAPLLKAALVLLWDRVPQPVAIEGLWEELRAKFEQAGQTLPPEHDRAFLCQALMRCFVANSVVLHVVPPKFAHSPGERPLASPVARYQATRASRLTNLLHQSLETNPFDRAVLALLDGTRDRDQLLDALMRSQAPDPPGRGDEPDQGNEEAHSGRLDREAVEQSLERLAYSGFLIR